MEKITIVEEGCPLCKGEIRGNKRILYFCKRCMILFREDVIMEKDLFADCKKS